MVNIFVFMKYEFLVRDKEISRYQLDAHDVDWFWRRASTNFNKRNMDEIIINLFIDDQGYPEEVSRLDPFYRNGYSVTARKLKSEFWNHRSTLTQALSNF